VTATPSQILTNGNFGSDTLAGWSVISQTNGGSSVSIIAGGVAGRYCLGIYTSYFINFAAQSVVYGQDIKCTPGQKYRVLLNAAVVSNYNNGNPRSVSVGGTTVASGGGAATAWGTYIYTHTCAGTADGNMLKLSMTSNNNREGWLQIDNVHVVPLTEPNWDFFWFEILVRRGKGRLERDQVFLKTKMYIS
jgi:hypothetical protein